MWLLSGSHNSNLLRSGRCTEFYLLTGYLTFPGIHRAVLIIYLTNHGISLSVIALAKSAQLIVSVLFNYPAGLISDRYGNKVTVLLACVAEMIYFGLMLHPSEQSVITGEMFNGLGIALYTGAYEAWIFTHKKGLKTVSH